MYVYHLFQKSQQMIQKNDYHPTEGLLEEENIVHGNTRMEIFIFSIHFNSKKNF